jgi:hypothetical protein
MDEGRWMMVGSKRVSTGAAVVVVGKLSVMEVVDVG